MVLVEGCWDLVCWKSKAVRPWLKKHQSRVKHPTVLRFCDRLRFYLYSLSYGRWSMDDSWWFTVPSNDGDFHSYVVLPEGVLFLGVVGVSAQLWIRDHGTGMYWEWCLLMIEPSWQEVCTMWVSLVFLGVSDHAKGVLSKWQCRSHGNFLFQFGDCPLIFPRGIFYHQLVAIKQSKGASPTSCRLPSGKPTVCGVKSQFLDTVNHRTKLSDYQRVVQ
jgi:hypothetical protein